MYGKYVTTKNMLVILQNIYNNIGLTSYCSKIFLRMRLYQIQRCKESEEKIKMIILVNIYIQRTLFNWYI